MINGHMQRTPCAIWYAYNCALMHACMHMNCNFVFIRKTGAVVVGALNMHVVLAAKMEKFKVAFFKRRKTR